MLVITEGIQPLLKWLWLGTPEEGHFFQRVTRGFKERLRDSSKQYQQNLDLRRRTQACCGSLCNFGRAIVV